MMHDLDELVARLRDAEGLRLKRDIGATVGDAPRPSDPRIRLGDDCAALPEGDGHLLFAIEGLLPAFVERDPWFAGYSGVMVNLSDVAAMGGRPLAVTDALWARDGERFARIWEGLAAASAAYDVPIVGGHTHARGEHDSLAVAVVGRARRLLTSFDARPGDRLLYAVDLRGSFHGEQLFWDASSGCGDHRRLREDLELLPALAEAGPVRAAKDVSMAGLLGTVLMLLECSGVGGTVDLDAVPRPYGGPLADWLVSFPSFGFVLAVRPGDVESVRERFVEREIACREIGVVEATRRLEVVLGGRRATFRDLAAEPLMSFGPAGVS